MSKFFSLGNKLIGLISAIVAASIMPSPSYNLCHATSQSESNHVLRVCYSSNGSMVSPPFDKLALIVTSSHSPNSAASCGGIDTVTNPLRLTKRLLKTGLNSMFQTISRIVFKHLRNTL